MNRPLTGRTKRHARTLPLTWYVCFLGVPLLSAGAETTQMDPPPTHTPANGTATVPYGIWSFRNGFGGHFPDADPPTNWAPDRNVAWKLALVGRSNASPVIVGERIFILSEPFQLICARKSDGRVLWERSNSREEVLGATAAALPRPEWLETYGYTSPTPVSDGQHLWCVFGNGVVVCRDLEGRRVWAAELGVASKISGVAVSPCVVDGALIVGGKGKDRLCGFEALTGRKLWATEQGAQEGSCVPVVLDGRPLVLASAGLLLEPRTGRILQRGMLGAGFKGDSGQPPINWGPTAATADGVAFFHVHFQPDQFNAALRAVRIGLQGAAEQLWEFYTNADGDIRGRMGNSPVLHEGLLYAVKDSGLLQVLDARNGQLVYDRQLPKHSYASLARAGPYLYAMGGSLVTVFRPGPVYRQVARFRHGFRDFMASPVFERRRLYFRDGTGLWCIEKPAGDNLAGASRASASGGAEQPTAQDAGGPAHSASDACGQAIDDGPDLADSAKTAPVLSLHEWLFEYDATRDRIRRVSLIVEWTLALSALAWGGWELRRSRTKPGWAWLAVLVAALALATPCLAYQDRLGNAYHPVLAWCLAGALLSWVWGNSPTEARPRAWSPAPPPKTRPHAVRTLSGLTWGLVLGGMAGLLAHHLPAQLALMAYILMGWQRV